MKTNQMDSENEKQYLKSEKENSADVPQKKVIEEGVTDGQGNFVSYVDGVIPDEKKEEAKGLKHKYRTYEDDSIVID